MSTNTEVANHLQLIAQLKALDGENRFSIKAYEDVAKLVRSLPENITDLDLTELPRVGEKTRLAITEFLANGTSSALQELSLRWDPSIMTLTIVDGIGPKRAYKLYQQGYHSFNELHQAAKDGELDSKLATAVINASFKQAGRLPYQKAKEIADLFQTQLGKVAGVMKTETGGSIRRKMPSCKDIDILCCVEEDTTREAVMKQLALFGNGSFQGGEKRGSIQFPVNSEQVVQVDCWIAEPKNWGSFLCYMTGSKDHNEAMRALAKSRGMKVNEYGIWDIDGNQLGGQNEEDLYSLLELPYIQPENRTGDLPL
jgi:DNA polymerase (family X)